MLFEKNICVFLSKKHVFFLQKNNMFLFCKKKHDPKKTCFFFRKKKKKKKKKLHDQIFFFFLHHYSEPPHFMGALAKVGTETAPAVVCIRHPFQEASKAPLTLKPDNILVRASLFLVLRTASGGEFSCPSTSTL